RIYLFSGLHYEALALGMSSQEGRTSSAELGNDSWFDAAVTCRHIKNGVHHAFIRNLPANYDTLLSRRRSLLQEDRVERRALLAHAGRGHSRPGLDRRGNPPL